MRKIELVQNSPEWLQFRRNHIGATDSGVIMGLNPWKSKKQLLEEKVFGWQNEPTEKMVQGSLLESAGLSAFQIETGIRFNNMVCISEEYPFMSASLDGISEDLQTIVEIKCGKQAFNQASRGIIPDYYYSQLQQQMCVSGLGWIFYYAFNGEFGITIKVERNDKFIERMIAQEIEFWEILKNWQAGKVHETVGTI